MRAAALLALMPLVLPAPAGARTTERERSMVASTARAVGLERIADRLAKAAEPTLHISYRLLRRAPAGLGSSRFGGPPDLPVGTRWPRCKGKPMAFLAQVRLGDLRRGDPGIPRRGLALFFSSVEEEEPGFGAREGLWMWAGDCAAVINSLGRPLRRTAAPRQNPRMVLRPAALRFRRAVSVPELDDVDRLAPPMHDVTLSRAEWDAHDRLLTRLDRRLRLEHRALGHRRSPNGVLGSCGDEDPALRPRHPWRLLLSLGPDTRLGWEVADAGALQFMIDPRGLRSGRLKRACAIFDSA